MIRITVELVSARTGLTTRLATAVITNDGTGSTSRGNYDAIFSLRKIKTWRTSRVEKFPRKYKSVWILVQRLLNEALHGER
jgi:hypothetical protein